MARRWRASTILGAIGLTAVIAVATSSFGALATPGPANAAKAVGAAPATAAPATVRRINEQQYLRSIHDIFGPNITVPGRFEPSVRDGGLLAVGDGRVAISPSGFEQYELRAREIAAQVLAEPNRKTIVACGAADATIFDRGCAEQFIGKYGRLLYRRPLTADEARSALSVAEATTRSSHDFYKGLQLTLSRLLVSPNFIFRVEEFQPDPASPGRYRLTDYSLATRLAFLLWNAPPDAALLDAAAQGTLHDPANLGRETDRLIASPRFQDGVRAFFSDMFGYDQFDVVSKDQAIFPIYSSQLAKDAKEQVLRTLVQLLVNDRSDYREIFTSQKTFMNRRLGGVYDVPVPAAGVAGWTPFVFRPTDNRAGILTLAAFLMLDATHEGRTSPTIRGKSVRELLLCQHVPSPPGNVNFALVQDVHNPMFKTARGRLTAHRDDPVCAGCHALTDPIGLSLEHYDAVGAFRTQENGAPIDASGKFEGKPYTDVVELEKLMRQSALPAECAAQRVYEYGLGRALSDTDDQSLGQLVARFRDSGYQFSALMREVATSTAFSSVSVPALANR